jgi:replicative DNA helicase
MEKNKKVTFDFGLDFQYQLIWEILNDHKFGYTIIDILLPEYFDNGVLSFFTKKIKSYYERHSVLPNTTSFKIEIESEKKHVTDELKRKQLEDDITTVINFESVNLNVQERALKFCKYFRVKNTIDSLHHNFERGKYITYDNYDEVEENIRQAITFKDGDESVDVFSEIDYTLSPDFRNPIPTGIDGIDEATNGGLSAGELGLLIAPLGGGKSTTLAKIANTAYNYGKVVLQIVFEDKVTDIKRKHYTIWSEISLNELTARKDEVKRIINEREENSNGKIIIHKFSAEGVTMSKIRNLIKKIQSKGINIDLITLDYLECVLPEKSVGRDEWSNEGYIMRQFETVLEDYNIAGWVATQGNRESIESEILTTNKMGGSLKKAQIGHLVVSIARTTLQKDQRLANIVILKNRFGEDGIIYEDCIFDPGRIIILTNRDNSIAGHDDAIRKKATESIMQGWQEKIAELKAKMEQEVENKVLEDIN